MRAKHLLTLAAIIAVTTHATPARAGVSVQVSVGWPAPVYVERGHGVRVVAASPPRHGSCSKPVYVRRHYAPVCRPVRVPPGRLWKHHGWKRHGYDRRGGRR